jgi:hypothetical protein
MYMTPITNHPDCVLISYQPCDFDLLDQAAAWSFDRTTVSIAPDLPTSTSTLLIATKFDPSLPINRNMPPDLLAHGSVEWTKTQRAFAKLARRPVSIAEFETEVCPISMKPKYKLRLRVRFRLRLKRDGGKTIHMFCFLQSLRMGRSFTELR